MHRPVAARSFFCRLRPILFVIGALPLVIANPESRRNAPVDGERALPNLALPTLGGRQLWADVEWRAGWRIQRHVWTGDHRVLDAHDVRRAWGGREACRRALDERVAALALAPQSARLVVLVHGLGRTRACWRKMRKALRADGFVVLDLSYPSTRAPIDAHAAPLAELLDRLEGTREVSFVTHSLGGIVVRALFERDDAWRERIALGGVVMLGPPNQGARAAELASRVPLVDRVLGPALDELRPERPAGLPTPPAPLLIVRGERGRGSGWNPWIPGADDSVVASEETAIAGASETMVANCTHAFMPSNRSIVEATRRFLRER